MAREERPEAKRRRGRGWLAALVLIAVLGAAAVVAQRWPSAEEDAAAPEPQAVPVVTARVARGTALDTVATVGEVRARAAVTVASEVTGRVVEVAVADGAAVEQGQVIVRLDDERERAALAAAVARANEARLQFERTRELAERNVAAQAQLDQQRAASRSADAAVQQARTAVERRTIRAPFAGEVGFILVDPGAIVQPGTPITQLTSPPPLRLRFRLPARYLAGLDVGDRVEGRTEAYPGRTFQGRVVTVEPTVDRASRTFAAEAEFTDPARRLRPGMFLDATVVLAEREGVLLVPEQAVLYEGPTVYVYCVDEEGRARRARITTGTRRDGMVEVVEGLAEGDRVITEGVQKVTEGTRVEPGAGGTGQGGGAA